MTPALEHFLFSDKNSLKDEDWVCSLQRYSSSLMPYVPINTPTLQTQVSGKQRDGVCTRCVGGLAFEVDADAEHKQELAGCVCFEHQWPAEERLSLQYKVTV